MIDINLNKINKSYGFDKILNNIDLNINKGQHNAVFFWRKEKVWPKSDRFWEWKIFSFYVSCISIDTKVNNLHYIL